MKRLVCLVLALSMMLTLFCGFASAEEARPLRVAVQSYYCSTPVGYIMDKGWDKEAGIPFEISVFNGGAPINEAMAAGLWDVAVTGGAYIYAMARYDAKLIGHQINGQGGNGNAIYMRKTNPAAEIKGYNPDLPEVVGSPETIKGQMILQNTGTTSHYLASNYLLALGIDPSEMQVVSLDFAQLYSSFATGQGDLSAMTSPNAYKAYGNDEWLVAASLESLNVPLYEAMVCTKEAYEERYDDIVKFVELIYRANDEMAASEDIAFAAAKKWYTDNGKDLPDEDVLLEVRDKPLVTSEEARNIDLYDFCMKYADFYIECELIEADRRDAIEAGVCQDILDKALGK